MKTLYTNIHINSSPSSIVDATDIFSYIDSYFKIWKTDQKMCQIKHDALKVFELAEDMTFKQMFADPENQHLSQSEIIEFCKNHRDKLSQDWCTFFLFKANDQFFVARVRFADDGSLDAYVYRLEDDYVWDAEYRHRVVVPQLATEAVSPDSLTLTTFVSDLEQLVNKYKSEIK